MKESSVEDCPQNAWQTLMFPSKNAFRGDLRVRQHSLYFYLWSHFASESPIWVSPVCHSVLTLLFISFSMCHSFPYRYPPWFWLCIFCSVLLSCLPLALAGVSLPFRALSSPCRTRPRKAASAQSSRSGGEGGNVHVGMDSKHRWVGACWAPTTSSPSSMCVQASGLLWPQTVMWIFNNVKGLNWL